MKHTVYKVFTIGAYEKEEKWLNEMAAKGMILTDVGICRYVFEEGTPGEYTYRLELLNHRPSHIESVSYIKFLEDAGVEHVGSYLRWVYLRKKTQDGTFELYSDVDSKIKHYKRVTFISNVLSLIYVFISAIWLWEAWSQYNLYLSYIEKGFSYNSYHSPYIFSATAYVALAIIFQLIVIPVRKSMHSLRKEQKIRE